MALIIRGKHKGLTVEIHQFCNDWIIVKHPKIHNQDSIFNPTSLEYGVDEMIRISEQKDIGMWWGLFKWKGNRLTKIK